MHAFSSLLGLSLCWSILQIDVPDYHVAALEAHVAALEATTVNYFLI